MAHVQKSTKAASGHLIDHYERDPESKVIRSNKNIDSSRTHLNYNLAPKQDQIEFLHNRLQEVKCLNRQNVNVMCTWAVTVPVDLPQEKHKEFFQEAYKFLENRYGKENVISSYVHMDETTPHMHFAFVPVVHDVKKGKDKVSAKECISRNELQRFHPDLKKHLEKALGCPVNVLNGATASGNKTIEELKADTIKKENASLQMDNIILEGTNENLNNNKRELLDECEVYHRATEKKKEVLIKFDRMSKNTLEELTRSNKELLETKSIIVKLKHEENILKTNVSDLNGKIQTLNNQVITLDEEVKEKKDLLNKLSAVIRDTFERIFKSFWERAKRSVTFAIQYPPELERAESILHAAKKEADNNIEVSLPVITQESAKQVIKSANDDIMTVINKRRVNR